MTGVWAVYHYDVGPYLVSVHPSELEACRVPAHEGYGYVVFLPWGMSLSEAIAAAAPAKVG